MVNSSVTNKGRIYKWEQENVFSRHPWKNWRATSKEFYWFLSHTTWISVKHINPKTDVMRFLEISIGRMLHNIRVSFTFGGQKQKWVCLQVRQTGKQSTLMGFHPVEQLCNGRLSITSVQFSSVTQSFPSLQPHEPQHARPPYPSPTVGVYPNPCTLIELVMPSNHLYCVRPNN